MTFPDILPALKAQMSQLRGRLVPNQPLAEFTWFRVGGPAQLLFMAEDEQDLSYFLTHLPPEIPVTVIGLGSNLIVRDGGVPGVVIRLGRGFSNVAAEPGARIRAGAAVPDVKVARAAQDAAIAGLAFLRGIPRAVGCALRMHGGAYGGGGHKRPVSHPTARHRARPPTFPTREMNPTHPPSTGPPRTQHPPGGVPRR